MSHGGEWMGKAEAVQATGATVALTAAATPVVASRQGSFAEAMQRDEVLHAGTASEQTHVDAASAKEIVAGTVVALPSVVAVSPKVGGVAGQPVVVSDVTLKPRVVAGAATKVLPQEMDEAAAVVRTGLGEGVGKDLSGLAAADNKRGVDVPALTVSAQEKDVTPQIFAEKVVVSPVVGKSKAVPVVSMGAAEESASAKPAAAVAKLVKHSVVQGAGAAAVDGHGQAVVAQGVATANAVAGLQPVAVSAVVASISSVASAFIAAVSAQGAKVGADDKGVGAKGLQSVGAVADVAVGKAVTPEVSASVVGATVSSSAVATTGALGAGVASGVEKSGGLSLPVTAVQMPGLQATSDGGVRRAHEGVSVSSGGQSHGMKELTLQTYEGSSPNRLEVGLQGGAFGALKVRAELGANGDVNAYLRGASSGSAELLQTQAPKIEAYLGAQAVVVKSVQVETVPSADSSTGAGTMGDGAAGGSGSQQQGRSSGRQSGYEGSVETLEQAVSGDSVMLPQVMSSAGGVSFTGNGSWLSVRA